ncbi:DUF3305 domain-containing protein [Falsiroseomonas selenitidurans]|uniref:DUF3305 domain-containing protein n=1 Tax=Falsiroseomonas selenitidurans TaxID=2716335 RepID=A0ABX1DY37_9PROT|nr:DUF3305 domain-containing protein [Falsiroseomonas selenitidurans]NKC29784.1 DUF3305 domain-containing protein [Falsiroseomonas selenitidurans]
MRAHNPESLFIPLAVLVERRPGVTRWAEEVWRAIEVLEEAPAIPPWTLLRQEPGRSVFFAGVGDVALHPTDTDNYRHNLASAQPLVWALLRPAETPPGLMLHSVTADPGEAHLHADVGQDLLESLPMPPGLRATMEAFCARHHKERGFWKRRRDQADPEALAHRSRIAEPEE